MIDRGFVITAELLRDAYFDKVESLKEHSLMSVLEAHNSQCRSMVGKTVAKSTYFNFEHGGKLLQEYIRASTGGMICISENLIWTLYKAFMRSC